MIRIEAAADAWDRMVQAREVLREEGLTVTTKSGTLEENGLKLEQTRGRDHDPCDEGGKAREQQQILQDDGHRKSPYAAPSNRSEQSCR